MSGCTPPCWQIILFFGNLIRTKLPRLCRFSGNHLSGCNKRGAPGCQVWSWTSTFLSTWAPDAFPCSDQTTCLWAAVVWHATHMGPLTEQQLTHKVIKKKKKNNQSSPGVDFCPFFLSYTATPEQMLLNDLFPPANVESLQSLQGFFSLEVTLLSGAIAQYRSV